MLQPVKRSRSLEGQHVFVAMADGSDIDHCGLVSVSTGVAGSLRLLDDGLDVVVPLAYVVDLGPQQVPRGGSAA